MEDVYILGGHIYIYLGNFQNSTQTFFFARNVTKTVLITLFDPFENYLTISENTEQKFRFKYVFPSIK